MKQTSLKPQDVIILAQIILKENKNEYWRMCDIAYLLDISQSEICRSLQRLQLCNLFDSEKRKPNTEGFLEFIEHGLKYVFPALVGKIEFGLHTACDIETEETLKEQQGENLVWPNKNNEEARGETLVPLYKSLSRSEFISKELKRILILIDSIRFTNKNLDVHLNQLKNLLMPNPIRQMAS